MSTARRERLRRQTRDEILSAAWELCREQGLAGLSLRELAARVDLRASSLYAYFDSKSAIYDAMFRQGYEQLIEQTDAVGVDGPIDRDRLKARLRAVFAFWVSDPVRYQLLFQRTVPDFEPSPASYALAVAYLDSARAVLAEIGADSDEAVDLWTALWTGLTDQQISNDPGGDRWQRLIDDAVDMYLDHQRLLIDTNNTKDTT